ncbi:hypothetical protein Saso_54520 [Streptomyces asoensis]|uniref:Uncharacterized protein n=1 Tax=Streptomyces asoensis TaxID=249586 RepID=A0ABQ3S6Y9_9ACTN|nr:hypothetical protein GCM10010496_47110 [Streptomyces asoensis]GHI63802.1 hypothetical protein Saso_54520 [Streptomyces asoensis]
MGAAAGAASADPVRDPQTVAAVRPRVAAQRAVFRIVCILPLDSGVCRSGSVGAERDERESAESATESHIDPMGFSNLAC